MKKYAPFFSCFGFVPVDVWVTTPQPELTHRQKFLFKILRWPRQNKFSMLKDKIWPRNRNVRCNRRITNKPLTRIGRAQLCLHEAIRGTMSWPSCAVQTPTEANFVQKECRFLVLINSIYTGRTAISPRSHAPVFKPMRLLVLPYLRL